MIAYLLHGNTTEPYAMLDAITMIAERRIREAVREGRLDHENWRNKPLPAEDDSHLPADLRMAYKVLKNAGYLPPEIETRKEIQQVEELLAAATDEQTRLRQMKKLNCLVMKVNRMRQGPIHLEMEPGYYRRVVEKISVPERQGRKETAGHNE